MTAGILLLTFPFALSGKVPTCQNRHSPVNIVIINVDDLGWKDLECYGSTFYETPNIDRLARQGVRFTDAYSACNVCAPSRHALLTGKWHMGIRDQEALKRGEYGFDIHEPIRSEGGNTYPRIVTREEDPKEIAEITDKSIGFVESAVKQKRPFLLYMAHHMVHVELQTTPELHAKYEQKAPGNNGQNNPHMGGMIEDLDREMGRFFDKLRELKVDDNTLIVFTSDNGGLSGQHGKLVTSQAPLRAGKGSAYEGGTRVPLIIKGPSVVKNSVSSVPTMQIDLYQTLLDLAGLPNDDNHIIDGLSLVPILRGKAEGKEDIYKRESLFWHYPHYKASTLPYSSIRKGDYKLIVYHEQELSPLGGKPIELFNLKEDPEEKKNLADALPDKRDALYQEILSYRLEMEAQMPEVNNNYQNKKTNNK